MPKITLEMNSGIDGVLVYRTGNSEYRIPVEHFGDYSGGFVVFVNHLWDQLEVEESEKPRLKSEILRNLQQWAKSNEKLSW